MSVSHQYFPFPIVTGTHVLQTFIPETIFAKVIDNLLPNPMACLEYLLFHFFFYFHCSFSQFLMEPFNS